MYIFSSIRTMNTILVNIAHSWDSPHVIVFDHMQMEFFGRFKEERLEYVIELKSFQKLKPYYVRKLKERNT